MPSQTKNRITVGISTRRYDEGDPECWEFFDIHQQEDDRTRALTSQFQQGARANRQPLSTLSAAVVNRLRQAATSAAVATNATTTKAQAQHQRLVIEEPKPRKLFHCIVIINQPSLLQRPPTPLPNHIPVNQLEAGETSPGRASRFAGPCQYRHSSSLMQELSGVDFSTDEELESVEKDMADDGEEREMEEWETEVAQSRSGEDMAEDIRRTPLHKRTEVLSPAALAEQSKMSPATCKSHIEQATVPEPPPTPPTAQAITLEPMFPC